MFSIKILILFYIINIVNLICQVLFSLESTKRMLSAANLLGALKVYSSRQEEFQKRNFLFLP